MASSARTEQCIFTGGSPSRASATALLVRFQASSTVLPFTSSVAMLDDAMAEAQPKVLNLMSVMTSFSTRR